MALPLPHSCTAQGFHALLCSFDAGEAATPTNDHASWPGNKLNTGSNITAVLAHLKPDGPYIAVLFRLFIRLNIPDRM